MFDFKTIDALYFRMINFCLIAIIENTNNTLISIYVR